MAFSGHDYGYWNNMEKLNIYNVDNNLQFIIEHVVGKDEYEEYKDILDAVGDVYLLGHNLIGAFEGYKSGHALNNELLKTLLANEKAWEYTTLEDASKSRAVNSYALPVLEGALA